MPRRLPTSWSPAAVALAGMSRWVWWDSRDLWECLLAEGYALPGLAQFRVTMNRLAHLGLIEARPSHPDRRGRNGGRLKFWRLSEAAVRLLKRHARLEARRCPHCKQPMPEAYH